MAHFIMDFYYGKCESQARGGHYEDILRLSDSLDEKEKFLSERLEGQEKDIFTEYAAMWNTFSDKACADSLVTGFRIGARFAIDVFGEGEE